MIFVSLAIFACDDYLDTIKISGFLQNLRSGRDTLPRGLALLALMMCILPLAAKELTLIFKAKQIQASQLMMTLASLSGCLLIYALPQNLNGPFTMVIFATLAVVLLLLALVKHAYRTHSTDGATAAAAATMFSLVYLGILPGFLLAIRRWHASPWVVLAIILIPKMCDTGAYFTGRAFGKHKLIPWLSPGKTWEGLIGGACFSAFVAFALAYLNNRFQLTVHHFDPFRSTLAGLIMGLAGQFGDLIASLLKRDAQIKDSGNTIPGFGGIIDVLDSPLVVAPLAYWLLQAGQYIEHTL